VADASETRIGGQARYAPLVPTFSPYTADAGAAVRLAWRVTLLAALTLLVVVVGGPLARNWYVNSAIEPRPAELTSIDGVVFIRRQGSRDWITAGPDVQVQPGDTVRTAANARAFVQLFDQSTVLLYPSSTMRVMRAEQGRFRMEKSTVVLELSGGRARIGVAPHPDGSSSFFQVRTPHTAVHLEEGSYSADVARDATQVRVRRGEATAYAGERQAANAKPGQRLAVRPDRPAQGNQPLRADLLENGYFADKAGTDLVGWSQIDVSEVEPPGRISLTEVPGAVTFRREGRGHGETLISQQLDMDLWDFESLRLTADVRVLSHSLSGGGWLGSEYPLMLRVTYRDARGGQRDWIRGFYLTNEDGYPTTNGVRVPSTDWHHVDVDLLALTPRPWRIEKVDVLATGWDYVSAVREVHIWAE
jgi:hypothetical protein